MLIGSDKYPAFIKTGGVNRTLGFYVGHAFQESGMTSDEWNELPHMTRDALIQESIESHMTVNELMAQAADMIRSFNDHYPMHSDPENAMNKIKDKINQAMAMMRK